MAALKKRILRGEHQLVLERLQEVSTRMPVYLACLFLHLFRQLQHSPLLHCHVLVCCCLQDRSLAWPTELEALVQKSAMEHADAVSGRYRWNPVMEDVWASKLPHSAQLTKNAVRVV